MAKSREKLIPGEFLEIDQSQTVARRRYLYQASCSSRISRADATPLEESADPAAGKLDPPRFATQPGEGPTSRRVHRRETREGDVDALDTVFASRAMGTTVSKSSPSGGGASPATPTRIFSPALPGKGTVALERRRSRFSRMV